MKSTLNPSWPQYLGIVSVLLALLLGLVNVLLNNQDLNRCHALLNRGSWLDSSRRNWQPDGCMLFNYQPDDAAACLNQRSVVFIGDSVTRTLFFQTIHVLDPDLPSAPPDDQQKHADHSFHTRHGSQVKFYWDPFLNTSETLKAIVNQPKSTQNAPFNSSTPSLLVLGSGLWHLHYAETSGGVASWEANMDHIFQALATKSNMPADTVVVLPVPEVVSSKLSPDRASTMHSSDIHAMNSDLFHRINPSGDGLHFFTDRRALPIALPLAFNEMLDASDTDDGLHFADALVKVQAEMLLNLRCNNVLPKKFPFDKTCCRDYSWPTFLQTLILGILAVWGPFKWLSQRSDSRTIPPIKEEHIPMLAMGAAVLLIYLADRTGLWLKEQKAYSPWSFGFLCIVSLAVGFGTVRRADKDLGFLNRDQTDEWKGWMQFAILIYHYVGASKISGIYNPIRVLVASYLFMTGYGHMTYYMRKADFGFLRVAQVLVRLNLLTLLLAYTMNTNYLSYYFSPLVSQWFLIIYGTMALGWQFNDNIPFLLCKLAASAGVVTWFFRQQWLLKGLFQILARVFAIHWDAREWAFRVNLDLWIVYVGMFTALAVIKLHELRLTEDPRWPLAIKVSLVGSAITIFWYFAFELLQESKIAYNQWHPYIAFLPVLAFVTLRNANVILRSASSRAFTFIGRCSLETFIIQFHFWLAADSKGVLLVLPGTKWRPVNFVITSIMFIYLSHNVAQATGHLTTWICGNETGSKKLPAPATNPVSERTANVELPDARQNDPPSTSPSTPPRWAERLTTKSTTSATLWAKPGVKVKLAIILCTMWAVNLLWTY